MLCCDIMLKLNKNKSEIKKEKLSAKKRRRNKKIINYSLLTIIILVVLAILFSWISQLKEDGKYDGFAKCLTESGAGMYGTDWCTNCQDQKRAFGSSFKNVVYINCDMNPVACESLEIDGYPTWVFSDNSQLVGKQTMFDLANKTGCVLP